MPIFNYIPNNTCAVIHKLCSTLYCKRWMRSPVLLSKSDSNEWMGPTWLLICPPNCKTLSLCIAKNSDQSMFTLIMPIKQIVKPVLTPDQQLLIWPIYSAKVETVVPMWLQLFITFVLNGGSIKIKHPLFSTRHDSRVCVFARALSPPKASVSYINRGHIVVNINFGITTLGLYLLHNNPLGYFRSVQKLYNTRRRTYVMRATHGQRCEAWQDIPVQLQVPVQPAHITKSVGTRTLLAVSRVLRKTNFARGFGGPLWRQCDFLKLKICNVTGFRAT